MCATCNADPAIVSAKWLTAFPELRCIMDPAWQEAFQFAQEQILPPGKIIVHKGDPCQHLLLVAQGTIRVYQSTESGRERVLYRISAGDICVLTLQNLLAGTDYLASAVTEDVARVVSIPADHFRDALEHSPGFRNIILSTLARRLNEMTQLIEQVAFQGLDLRLACLLGHSFGHRRAKRIPVTHQELAVELGTSREVVSRLLKNFERQGCIVLHRGEIELLSSEALAHLSRDHPQ